MRETPFGALGVLGLILAICPWTTAAFAQGPQCTVSILNQSTQVAEDGSWLLANVPSNMGPVRARMTCVDDGETLSGSSDFFTVTENRMNALPGLVLGEGGAEPAEIDLTVPTNVLTSPGQTVSLAVTATLSDASVLDVTASVEGTTYRSSNSRIASVSSEGVVTAHLSGRALVSALYDGVLAAEMFDVTLSGDTDGDGLPDDFEVAMGLDPNDPADALLDPDRDGLSTLEEFQLGLDPFDEDSDDDGLLDGEEVNTHGTDPLLFDTDGDGLSDGLEIETGSDPLDPSSFNLAAALDFIEVSPNAFTIVFNTVMGEASRQLTVTGNLIDGTTLDITSDFYGTSYSSSDLTIANFGSDPGRVFAGLDGNAVVTASNSGFAANVAVTVETFSPTALSFLPFPFGGATALEVEGDYAYVLGSYLLTIVDVSDLAAPIAEGEFFIPGAGAGGGGGMDLVQEAGFAYLAMGNLGVRIVDVSNPQAPALVATIYGQWPATALAHQGTTLFVGGPGNLAAFDVSDPAAPQELGQIAFSGRLVDLEITGDLLVAAAGRSGLLVFDISDPAMPSFLGQGHTRASSSRAAGLAVDGVSIVVADGYRRSLGGLRQMDLSEPAAPALVGSTGNAFGLTAVELDESLALAADFFFVNAVPIFQVGDGDPIFRGALDFSGPPSFRDDDGVDLALQDGAVFLLAGEGLHIGRYRIPSDTEGISPRVEVTSPTADEVISGRTFLTVEAEAEDDQAVSFVEFLVDGELLRRDVQAPFSASFFVPGETTSLTLTAIATDEGGNSATSEPVLISVAPNTEPTIALSSPRDSTEATVSTAVSVVARATDDEGIDRVEFWVDGSLRQTVTTPPYRFDWTETTVRTGSVSAMVFDELGFAAAGPRSVTWVADAPPIALLVEPADGQEVAEGSIVPVVIAGGDDVGLSGVDLLRNGQVVWTESDEPPWETTITAPLVGEDFRIQARVRDTALQQVTTPEINLSVTADPLNAVQGRVLDEDLLPVEGASVEIQPELGSALTGTSLPNGTFEILGIPSNRGELTVTASIVLEDEVYSGSYGTGILPIPGGSVFLGDVIVRFALPSTRLVGSVADDLGVPLAGTTVRVHNRFESFETLSDASGNFLFPRVPAANQAADQDPPILNLFVSGSTDVGGTLYRGRIPAPISPIVGGETDAGTLILQPDAGLPDPLTMAVGVVFDSAGEQMGGAEVNILTDFDLFQTTTLADGSFSLADIPTVDGDLFATVAIVVNGLRETGESEGLFSPVPGGTTDFGDIYIGDDGPCDPCGVE